MLFKIYPIYPEKMKKSCEDLLFTSIIHLLTYFLSIGQYKVHSCIFSFIYFLNRDIIKEDIMERLPSLFY